MDSNSLETYKKQDFDVAMSGFKLKYIGCATVFSGKTSLGGVKSEKDMFLKVCTRAVDKSISELQKVLMSLRFILLWCRHHHFMLILA